jgi:hypothetical protein
MKRKIFIGIAGLALVVAAAAITTISTINANTPESDLLSKNLEALTRSEVISANCAGTSSSYCGFTCVRCGALNYTPYAMGPSSNISGTCSACFYHY